MTAMWRRDRVRQPTRLFYCPLPGHLQMDRAEIGIGAGFSNVKENVSPVSMTRDLKAPSVLTTVCGMSSRFFEVTVVPRRNRDGLRAKAEIINFHFAARAASCAHCVVGFSFHYG